MAACSTEDGHDHVFKLLLIGDSCVGKSSLLARFTKGEVGLNPKPTTANNFVARHVYVDGKIIEAQIVDNYHKFGSLSNDSILMQNVVGALIVYDLTRYSTFEDVESWYSELHVANSDIEVTLIGNKSDLVDRSVTTSSEVGKAFAKKASVTFIETSAKDGRNVEKAFAELITRIFRKVIKNDRMIAVDAQASLFHSEARMSRLSGRNEPAHYMLKIDSFSLLSQQGTEKFESPIFEASGYKWKLELYPYGNEEENAGGNISIYLTIFDTKSLPKGWEVCVDCKFCVYDHLRDNYIIFQDVDGKRTRYNEKQIKWGFSKLISLDYFCDAENGCLYHDSCVFGAEVFAVPRYAEIDQCVSMIKPPAVMNTHTWIIKDFSAITEHELLSDHFKVGKVKWKLKLYPKGCKTAEGTHLSIFLQVHDSGSLSDGWRIFAKYKIRVKQQCGGRGADEEIECNHWFHDSDSDWGYSRFILLSELGDAEKGFLLQDVLIVEAEILIVGMLKDFN